MFREYTIGTSNPYCELMVDIDVETGKIVDLYYYADNAPVIENMETGKQYKVSGKAGQNPLFLHIGNVNAGRLFKLMLENDYIILLDDEDPEYQEDIEIVNRALIKYNVTYNLAEH